MKQSQNDPLMKYCNAILQRAKLYNEAYYFDTAGARYVRDHAKVKAYFTACSLVDKLRAENRIDSHIETE